MKLVLIGFATAYKSTVAKQLSQKLNLPLFDVDDTIQSQTGKTITQIFAEQGEDYFRMLESALLLQLSATQNCVISCGGGSVLSQEFSKLCQNATVIWLKVDAQNVASRLDGHSRPLFDGLTTQQLASKIDMRTPFYQKHATVQIDTSNKTSAQVFDELCQLLKI